MPGALLADSPLFVWRPQEKPSLPMKADRPLAGMPWVRGRTGGEPSPILVFAWNISGCVTADGAASGMSLTWEVDDAGCSLGVIGPWLPAALDPRRWGSPACGPGFEPGIPGSGRAGGDRSHRPTGPVAVRSSAEPSVSGGVHAVAGRRTAHKAAPGTVTSNRCPLSGKRATASSARGMGRAQPSPVAHLLPILIGHIDFEL